jgi:hypothetical protein
MRFDRVVPTLLLAYAAMACTKKPAEEQVMCTMEARSALAIVVVDSATGAGLASAAMAVVTEGAFTDTLRGVDSLLSGVHERAGTYRVEVTAPGYQPWMREGVLVTRDVCHVQTVSLRAPLARPQ